MTYTLQLSCPLSFIHAIFSKDANLSNLRVYGFTEANSFFVYAKSLYVYPAETLYLRGVEHVNTGELFVTVWGLNRGKRSFYKIRQSRVGGFAEVRVSESTAQVGKRYLKYSRFRRRMAESSIYEHGCAVQLFRSGSHHASSRHGSAMGRRLSVLADKRPKAPAYSSREITSWRSFFF